MPILVLTVLAQLFCAWHVVNSGRDKYWIWLIIIAPGLGCLIYFVTQILPDTSDSRAGRNVKQAAMKVIDPNRELREALHAFDMVESVHNRLRLADAYIALEKFDEAEPHLVQSLTGVSKSDPDIMLKLAKVRLHQKDPASCLELLDELQEENPGFQSQEGHLLYSIALADTGQVDEALESFGSLVTYATGEEARVRYGWLLQDAGYDEKAREILEEVIKRVKRGTKFYRKAQAKWQSAARLALEKIKD